MLSHPGPDKTHVYLMHWLYRKSRIYVVKWRWFLQPLRQKKWRHFMQIKRWRKEPNVWKSNLVSQKVCKKKYLSWVYGVDRKIRHSRSLFGITRQASWCRSVTLVTDFSIHTIHPWKILIFQDELRKKQRNKHTPTWTDCCLDFLSFLWK